MITGQGIMMRHWEDSPLLTLLRKIITRLLLMLIVEEILSIG